TYEAALSRLSRAGVTLHEVALPILDALPALFEGGGLVAAEAYAWHRNYLRTHQHAYDPRVSVRIQRGAALSAADYLCAQQLRQRFIEAWRQQAQERSEERRVGKECRRLW